MDPITPQELDLAKDELRTPGASLSRVARHLGLNYTSLRAAIHRPAAQPEEQLDPQSMGRESLREYAVAAKPVDGAWPPCFRDALQRAREAYDAGTHEMVQGREGDWIIQYLIPRMHHVRRRDYFRSEVI